jgi:Tol biopolymer transport system component
VVSLSEPCCARLSLRLVPGEWLQWYHPRVLTAPSIIRANAAPVASQLFFVMLMAASMQAQEPVRQQLERQQQQKGLTLCLLYFRELETVNFASRSFELRDFKVSSNGRLSAGAVSRDGEEIAFELSFYPPLRQYLGVAHSDGSGLREYPDVVSPHDFCWSNDKSKLALNAAVRRQLHGALVIVDLDSKATQEIEASAGVTSQCWSPDDKHVVYGVGDSIRIYDLGEGKWRELAKGVNPTWSPDGNWIAFYHKDAYYAIRPSGAERKQLFKQKDVRTGLWWSPDGSVVAYICLGGKYDPHRDFDFVPRQLRVRRLADNSDDWILTEPDVGYVPNFQWILPAEFKPH